MCALLLTLKKAKIEKQAFKEARTAGQQQKSIYRTTDKSSLLISSGAKGRRQIRPLPLYSAFFTV